ncbi:thymidylate synthase [Leptospira noguchii]|uniref:thymidylate synthase n=1 Tax=Leptospira noguchii TaxID=28182 RepID=A0AAE9GB45_9LEPT|nr:thymidylate synthase [Leptospira noguchii]UOG29501.1 thymidylate synthase [Leptospira noguchii]UOG35168.1 thymidylate synthase [Leptospira noguchii]UOG46077.1 thymidylate synthase [Leptospira noguchii]UOG53712.1 thymidylate synthase [Leptospira noguchii]UOG55640.1 thymidylate synthase [Leptospira noguchii]
MAAYERIIQKGKQIKPTRGDAKELTGVLLEIKNPRARLSLTERRGLLFSCIGEFLWYMSGSDDLGFISYYLKEYFENSDDGKTLYGAYGPRIFDKNGINQFQNIISVLTNNSDSRKAVIQLFDASDLVENHKDVPCTCSLQFLLRGKKLDLFTFMRSNDAYIGLPHDIFSFTMIQEIIANKLGVNLGVYKHFVGSLHLYTDKLDSARQYIEEGWQETTSMPKMPSEDSTEAILKLIQVESQIRTGQIVSSSDTNGLNPYWMDFVNLLHIFKIYKNENPIKNASLIEEIKLKISTKVYDTYIDKKKAIRIEKEQLQLPNI